MNPFDWPRAAFVWAFAGTFTVIAIIFVTIRDNIRSRRKRREEKKAP